MDSAVVKLKKMTLKDIHELTNSLTHTTNSSQRLTRAKAKDLAIDVCASSTHTQRKSLERNSEEQNNQRPKRQRANVKNAAESTVQTKTVPMDKVLQILHI